MAKQRRRREGKVVYDEEKILEAQASGDNLVSLNYEGFEAVGKAIEP